MLDDLRLAPDTYAEHCTDGRHPIDAERKGGDDDGTLDVGGTLRPPDGPVTYVHVVGRPGQAQLFRAEIGDEIVGGIVERTDRTWGWYLFPRYGGGEGDATHEDLARNALEAALQARRRFTP